MPDAGGQQETGRLAAAINTMLDRIQHSFSARLRSEQKVRQFAADASHELRTPLTTIRGYAELYRANALGPDELPNAMRRIEQEAERMSMLVAELLELARLDRPSSLDLSETDLTVLAKDAVADARAVEPDREVSTSVPRSLVVTADEPRIRQVLANLLGNVRAHTPPGTPATVRLYAAGQRRGHRGQRPGAGHVGARRGPAFDRFHRGEGALAAGRRRAPAGRARRDRGGEQRPRPVHRRRRSRRRTAVTPTSPPPRATAPRSACGSPAGSRPVIPNGCLLRPIRSHSHGRRTPRPYRTLVPYISPRGSASSSRRTPSGSLK